MTSGRAESATILVVDDQADVREAVSLLLADEGYSVLGAAAPQGALALLQDQPVALVLFDMNYSRDTTSGREGLELLAVMRALDKHRPLVAMTAWGSIDLAVQALQQGAADFVEKPWDNNRLLTIIRTQLERSAAVERARRVGRAAALERADKSPGGIVAEAESMRRLLDMTRRVADSDAPILITGENGVGKGLLAEQIHRWSPVADEVFITVNMGAIPESLFEAEMFGHAKGAFTDAREARAGRFELADGGTLFLDEVGNLPAAQQAKLLHVLETGEFERIGETRTRHARVRVIAATNADLQAMVEAGEFRRDLYFRLNTIELRIPPLSERPADVLPLAERFLSIQNRKYARSLAFSDAALKALREHEWPGNVRELAHAVERAVLLAGDQSIQPEHLMLVGQSPSATGAQPIVALEDLERQMIERALNHFEGDVLHTAEALGLSRSALYRRLEKYGIKTA
ncbi:sigma-54-dependent transcriptional regulator [Wenzhouxiangella limi]|uniref:Sigma-54-dependent Fis family transcriptional regulator n=1 Tax=Wenzhouxiangella limi TaxID=2707351 RepID=A0A845V3D8_9GAMM|nr:sigma-54 dependent transcriptional regulator [Wenzhouxiangella limi]NDY94761.1 sigma-54-dependent Fis family transcriptional regulator [Wenzhouxiangella limi]